jgi:hypothetical protein
MKTTTLKLKDHKSAQCHVIITEKEHVDSICFVSYSTPVIFGDYYKERNETIIKCTGTYSATTRKQIGYFLKEYFPTLNYYNMKDIAGTDILLGIKGKWGK